MFEKEQQINPIKVRIYSFIKEKGVKKGIFCEKVGVSIKNFQGNNAYSNLGAEKVTQIMRAFPELSPDWLLLGKGAMLRPSPPAPAASAPQEAPPAPAASAPQAAPPPKAAQAAPPPQAAPQAAPPPKAAQAAPHSQVDAIEENFHLSQIDTAVREPDLHNYGKGDHLGPLMRLDNPEITKLRAGASARAIGSSIARPKKRTARPKKPTKRLPN